MRWILEEFFFRSSWVLFFIFICLMAYESNLKDYHLYVERLQSKVTLLEKEKKEAQLVNESLQLKVLSQNDPAWVSLVLIEELGMVPKGHKKIIFKKSSDP